ncbi:hypothetical protein GCM10008083_29920 [Ulvibacter litoralis]|nr:hypothetical protein GCM10008083_29920 [Ulvibacter litoralis]
MALPEVTTRLTDDFSLEMPELRAYPIYVNATVEAPDEMQEVTIDIDGTVYTAEAQDGFYYYLWTPSSYGSHDVEIKAIALSGEETVINRTVSVVDAAVSQTVTSLQDVVIEFNGENSRWFYGTYTFPQFVGAYNDINASLEVECPSVTGGCDDWDRWAHIDIKAPDGNWVQLIRYITPYGVGCNHELNVTDYMSLLQGEVELRVFIDTWGTGGWQLTLDFDYTQGAPEYAYSDVVELWDDSYNFGDLSNLQPVPTYNANISDLVSESHLRISTTGHGWGANNTSNAAEFFNATHFIDVDTEETFSQHLWNDCNPNPDGCTGQQGTWAYNRAGWCPGAIAPPNTYDLTPYIGTSVDLDYRFHPGYIDNCHPNNPSCITGTTCADCNDGYNPVYYVDTHIINKSNNPMIYGGVLSLPSVDNTQIYDVAVFPNPSNGLVHIQSKYPEASTRLTVNTIDGKLVKAFYFNSASELNSYTFDFSSLSKGMYFINLENAYGTGVKRFILE